MNNEPVAYVDPIWMDRPDLVMSHQLEIGKLFARTHFKNYVPLYTAEQLHPVEEQDESFDRTASHMAGEYVSHPVKELTEKEKWLTEIDVKQQALKKIIDWLILEHDTLACTSYPLKKAQE